MDVATLELPQLSNPIATMDGELAINGGEPIVKDGRVMGSRWPLINADDVEALVTTFRSGLLTEMSGRTKVQTFEREITAHLGADFALTTNSGTAALHCA